MEHTRNQLDKPYHESESRNKEMFKKSRETKLESKRKRTNIFCMLELEIENKNPTEVYCAQIRCNLLIQFKPFHSK